MKHPNTRFGVATLIALLFGATLAISAGVANAQTESNPAGITCENAQRVQFSFITFDSNGFEGALSIRQVTNDGSTWIVTRQASEFSSWTISPAGREYFLRYRSGGIVHDVPCISPGETEVPNVANAVCTTTTTGDMTRVVVTADAGVIDNAFSLRQVEANGSTWLTDLDDETTITRTSDGALFVRYRRSGEVNEASCAESATTTVTCFIETQTFTPVTAEVLVVENTEAGVNYTVFENGVATLSFDGGQRAVLPINNEPVPARVVTVAPTANPDNTTTCGTLGASASCTLNMNNNSGTIRIDTDVLGLRVFLRDGNSADSNWVATTVPNGSPIFLDDLPLGGEFFIRYRQGGEVFESDCSLDL